MQTRFFILIAILAGITVQSSNSRAAERPNVVIVITDDQGYGDVAFTGNPAVQTPTLDMLRSQGTLLSNFHVDPTCAPTRSALMTGRYSDRVGVWHTVQGRNMLRRREKTMADIFGVESPEIEFDGSSLRDLLYGLGESWSERTLVVESQRVVDPIKWPVEADKGINDGTYGKAFNYKTARMRIGDIDKTVDIPDGAKEVTFKVTLKKGVTKLAPLFIGPNQTATPYYVYVTHQPKPGWQTPEGMGIPVYDPGYGRVPPQEVVSELGAK